MQVAAAASMVALTGCSASTQSATVGLDDTGGAAPTSTESAVVSTTEAAPTTTEPPLDVYDPLCVVKVAAGKSLSLIADRFDDDTVRVATIQAENDLGDTTIQPDQLLDVCVDNGLDDRTGEAHEPNQAIVAEATMANVELQQAKLNELFAGFGMAELIIDGVSGSVTRQRLCAARLGLGLPASTADMAAGSDEEQVLMAATELNTPLAAPVESERWTLIDQTCQVMFVGSGFQQMQFIFPTSTGEPGLRRACRMLPGCTATTRHPTTMDGTTAPSSRRRRTTRSTATCTSRCTSMAVWRSMAPTTFPRVRRARAAHVSASRTTISSSTGWASVTSTDPSVVRGST